MNNIISVSYTHLDVYKRQKKYNIMMSAFLDMYGKVTDEEILKYFKLSNLVDGSIDTLDTYVKTYRR